MITTEHQILSIGDAHLPDVARRVRDGADLSLVDRYRYAAWLADQFDALYQECQCAACTERGVDPNVCRARAESYAADDARSAALAAWLASDEPREWEVTDDGATWPAPVVERPSTIDERISRDVSSWGIDYLPDGSERGTWVHTRAWVIDPVSGDRIEDSERRETHTIEPSEPDCDDDHGEHAWVTRQGPYGSGGGVRYTDCCEHCGVYRTIDTGAHDPATGEQGLTSTEYGVADEEAVAWIASRQGAEVES
jgi:hypothetical protein